MTVTRFVPCIVFALTAPLVAAGTSSRSAAAALALSLSVWRVPNRSEAPAGSVDEMAGQMAGQMTSDGFIAVPDRPGMGVEVDLEQVERYRVA